MRRGGRGLGGLEMNAAKAWILSDDLAAYVKARGGVLTIGTFDVLIG